LDHRLTGLFNGAMLLLAEFLLLNNEDNEGTNKLCRAYSTTDGAFFFVICLIGFYCVIKPETHWTSSRLCWSTHPVIRLYRTATFAAI